MFGFFKRNAPADATQPRRDGNPKRKTADRRGLDAPAPLPTPEVTEGNSEADWSLWADSVAFQDSQLPNPYPDTLPVPLETARANDPPPTESLDTVRGSDL